MKEQPGSSSVVQGVARDRFALGYSGIGYQTADVARCRWPSTRNPISSPPSRPCAYAGEYPLARFLYVYVNYQPGTELDPLRREFIRYLFSKQGQSDVIRCGYLPVGNVIATKALASVGVK